MAGKKAIIVALNFQQFIREYVWKHRNTARSQLLAIPFLTSELALNFLKCAAIVDPIYARRAF